jgi:cytoskeletal protein CcmA (bactofilin family)
MAKFGSGWEKRDVGRRFGRKGEAAAEASKAPVAEEHTAFIQAGCEVEGTLALKNSLRVQGDFRGSIDARNTVTVDEGASVNGNIRARTVVIYGAVVGDVDASRDISIHTTGKLHGDVKTPAFQIDRGAFFSGRTEMFSPQRVANAQPDADASLDSVSLEGADSSSSQFAGMD